MIDSHCHLDVPAFDRDREAVLLRAKAAGVEGILVPAIRWDVALADPMIRIGVGFHPQIVPDLVPSEIATTPEALAAFAKQRGAVAIGECGLDGNTGEKELQEELFRMHIRAARIAALPLVVHVFHAHDRAPQILREERATGGVMHSYSGGADLVPTYVGLGFAISFAGPVAYPNARKPLEAVRRVPLDHLLVETDSPDQSSRPGQRAEPGFLPDIVAAIAAARALDPGEVASTTAANARRVFAAW
ncbi:MAG: TatD family hydrolase [Kofleriaceae bacterium]